MLFGNISGSSGKRVHGQFAREAAKKNNSKIQPGARDDGVSSNCLKPVPLTRDLRFLLVYGKVLWP